MSGDLGCECGDIYDSEWYYLPPKEGEEFTTFQGPLPCTCGSCDRELRLGEECMKFPCYTSDECEVDEDGNEDDAFLYDIYLCGECSEQWLNLTDIGYCIPINENVMDYLRQYWELTGFVPPEEADGTSH